jgi:hypothetical protein
MVDTSGLSLDQAPPIHLPLRLLLTAPWFAAAAGLVLMSVGEPALVSRWTPAALALTHLITVGFLGQAMCGALLQMLPVIAGAPVPGVRGVAAVVHLALAAGAGLLAAGFLGSGAWALTLGAAASVLGFAVFLIASGVVLARARGAPGTLWSLRLAGVALIPTLVLGTTLVSALLGWVGLPAFATWVDLHLAWGLPGWVGLLIVGVGYQVVPMFHVTPAYPKALTRALAPALFAVLVAASLATLLHPAAWAEGAMGLAQGGAALGLTAFALVTLRLQRQRSRRRRDATLLHWWSAMGSLVAAAGAWGLGAPDTLIGVLLLVGVGIGLPSGMLFKIVPFLCWFHLQQRQIATGCFAVRVPHMHGFLPEGPTRWQWWLHLGALVTLAAAVAEPRLTILGGGLLVLASLLLAGLLGNAALRYRRTRASLGQPANGVAVPEGGQ